MVDIERAGSLYLRRSVERGHSLLQSAGHHKQRKRLSFRLNRIGTKKSADRKDRLLDNSHFDHRLAMVKPQL
jgi:hypothetical protein